MLASYATDWLGADNVRRFGVQFREQVWPGDSSCAPAPSSTRDEGDGERTVDARAIVARGSAAAPRSRAWATFAVPDA